jgi:NAD(P)H dehydrogenase (quinone)
MPWRDGSFAAGQQAGAVVRLRQVPELAPAEAIASNVAWSQHLDRTKDEPKATATSRST